MKLAPVSEWTITPKDTLDGISGTFIASWKGKADVKISSERGLVRFLSDEINDKKTFQEFEQLSTAWRKYVRKALDAKERKF